jgi:hypothetical protein
MKKVLLFTLLLGIGLIFKTTPVSADDNCPCDGVCYTTDGCPSDPWDWVACAAGLQQWANDQCALAPPPPPAQAEPAAAPAPSPASAAPKPAAEP